VNKVFRHGFGVLVFLMFVIVFTACALGQEKPKLIRIPELFIPPAPPVKIESNKLSKGVLYYVDSDIPVLVMAAPTGLIKITQAPVTPVTTFASFVDTKNKDFEFRTFKGKDVFFISGIAKGTVTLFIIPKGLDIKEEDAKTKTIEVFPEEGDNPDPPAPDDKTDVFYKGIKAAYIADAMDSMKIKKLKELYDYAVFQADSAATWSDLFILMQSKAQELKVDGNSNVPNTKAYLQSYLKSTLPSIGAGPKALTPDDRTKAKTEFQKISNALNEVLK